MTQVEAAIADGKVKVEYHVVSFLDRASEQRVLLPGGQRPVRRGRHRGRDVFAKYHALLYENQPAEGTDGPDDDQLVAWAVEAGADEDAVRPAIEDKVFEQWVTNATDQMSQDGVNGTPGRLHRRPAAARPRHGGERRPPGRQVTGPDPRSSQALPKAELHVHHVGSASARIVGELAERHPGVVPSDPDQLRDFFAFRDFAHFVEVYLSVVDLIRHRRGHPVPDLRGRPRDGRGPADPVRRADVHAVHLRHARHPDRGVHRGDRGRPDRGGARLRPGAALDLRHPGGERRALGRRDARLRARPPRGRARRLRARRTGDRRASRAVPAALRRRPRRRAAQRAARRRDDRARDHLGVAAAARCRADRSRHVRRARPGAARAPRRDRHRPRGLPVVQRRHARGGLAGRAPAAPRSSRRA